MSFGNYHGQIDFDDHVTGFPVFYRRVFSRTNVDREFFWILSFTKKDEYVKILMRNVFHQKENGNKSFLVQRQKIKRKTHTHTCYSTKVSRTKIFSEGYLRRFFKISENTKS